MTSPTSVKYTRSLVPCYYYPHYIVCHRRRIPRYKAIYVFNLVYDVPKTQPALIFTSMPTPTPPLRYVEIRDGCFHIVPQCITKIHIYQRILHMEYDAQFNIFVLGTVRRSGIINAMSTVADRK
ncbi:uncharacterized protein LOC113375869 [Ctenocephalides felis]|uniref:uncharacterized protein LOC113375869 n=1 Tax=Ctenocephalides felis TaxID=7515 RepID=UPI000E6E4619|nr:uncharacterized protein LOC113375869 [Ctenocephalides felis]